MMNAVARGIQPLPLPRRVPPNLIRLTSVVLVLVVWEYAGGTISPLLFSTPTRVAAAFVELTVSGELPLALLISLRVIAISLVIGTVVGIAVGLLMGRFKLVEDALESVVLAIYVSPSVAFIPLLIIWFGLDTLTRVILVTEAVLIPVLMNTHIGVRDVSARDVEIARAFGFREWQIFYKVILPATVPYIVSGFRLAVGRATHHIIAAEFFTILSGLGGILLTAATFVQTSRIFVVIIVLMVLGVSLTELVKLFERRVAPWKETERARR